MNAAEPGNGNPPPSSTTGPSRGTVPYEVWSRAAIAHLEINDEAGYHRLVEILRSRHPADIPEGWVGAQLADACVLGPGGIGGEGKPRIWADCFLAMLRPDRKNLRHAALRLQGIVLHRSGKSREAIDRIREGIAIEDGALGPEDATWLAMAYFETGNLAKAIEMLALPETAGPVARDTEFWDTQSRRLLRREAERLILDRGFPPEPFAP